MVPCDEQVLRRYNILEYRRNDLRLEENKIGFSQLFFGLSSIKNRENMVVILHKLQSWDTFGLVYPFSEFARIRLLKPLQTHRMRGTSNMVATEVDTDSSDAIKSSEDRRKIGESQCSTES